MSDAVLFEVFSEELELYEGKVFTLESACEALDIDDTEGVLGFLSSWTDQNFLEVRGNDVKRWMCRFVPRELPVVKSATGVSTYARCPRKEFFRKIAKVPKSENRFAAFGKRTHDILENWLKEGTPPDLQTPEGKCANRGLKHCPPPMLDPDGVEGMFIEEMDGHMYKGAIDFEWKPELRPDGHNKLWGPGVEKIPLIIDHKTTGDFQYSRTAEELETDEQALIYAKRATLKYPDAPAVDLLWNNLLRNGKRDNPVRVRLPLTKIVTGFTSIVHPLSDGVETMAREAKHSSEVEPNFQACGDYGGCPFINKCNPSPVERLRYEMKSKLQEKLDAKRAEKNTGGSKMSSRKTAVKAIEPDEVVEAAPKKLSFAEKQAVKRAAKVAEAALEKAAAAKKATKKTSTKKAAGKKAAAKKEVAEVVEDVATVIENFDDQLGSSSLFTDLQAKLDTLMHRVDLLEGGAVEEAEEVEEVEEELAPEMSIELFATEDEEGEEKLGEFYESVANAYNSLSEAVVNIREAGLEGVADYLAEALTPLSKLISTMDELD